MSPRTSSSSFTTVTYQVIEPIEVRSLGVSRARTNEGSFWNFTPGVERGTQARIARRRRSNFTRSIRVGFFPDVGVRQSTLVSMSAILLLVRFLQMLQEVKLDDCPQESFGQSSSYGHSA